MINPYILLKPGFLIWNGVFARPVCPLPGETSGLWCPFPTAKLPSYHGMLSEGKLSHQFPIKQILATNSITTMRRTNYSSRTMSPLAHFCPIIVCLFVQPGGWGREGAKYESLHILVAILILSSWSPLVLFQKFRLIVYIILDAIPLKVTLIPPWWPPDTCPFPDKISSRSS